MDYSTDELPLPSFVEIFGDGVITNPIRKKKKNTPGKIEIHGEEATGRWTSDEHRLFLEGIMLYGKDWKKMQPLIKTRSLVQIRTHAQKVFKKIGLKKMPSLTRRRGSSGGKDGNGDVDHDLEDVLDDELEHLGMMENVDESMLSSLPLPPGHSIVIPPHLMHNPHNMVISGHLPHAHLQQHAASPRSIRHNAYPPNPGLQIDVHHHHHHHSDIMNGLQVATPMMSHHQENVFDPLHDPTNK